MKLSELVNIDELRKLCESFTALSTIATAMLDLDGNVLIATGWQDVCTCFHRVHPETVKRCRESDTILAAQLRLGEKYNVYKCKNGLVDVAVPITIEGEHIANFFTGQFLFEAPDMEHFSRQAEEFGFDKDSYIEAVNRVPIFSEDQVRTFMDFFTRLTQMVAKMGFAQKRLNETLSRLKESEDKFRTVADFTYDWECWIAPNMDILYCSPSCSRITGYFAEEFINNPNLLTNIVHSQDLKNYRKHIQRIHDPNMRPKEEKELEFRIITKTGDIKWIGHVCRQVFTIDGEYEGSRVSNRDITVRKLGEMNLLQSNEEINRLNINILNMIRLVSHDIRSPLVTMAAILELLQRGNFGSMDVSVANTVKDLSVRVKQILGIADDCLGKANTVDSHMKIEKQELDLRQEVIDPVLEELKSEIVSGEITIDNRLGAIPTGAIVIHASQIWLKAVYRNLFMNAMKYGGHGCTIAFGYEDIGNFYQLTVYNTGNPIPEENRITLFTKFGRVGEEAGQEGIGMGLFLIKEIINQHGGDIRYEEIDNGSAFIFTLPK